MENKRKKRSFFATVSVLAAAIDVPPTRDSLGYGTFNLLLQSSCFRLPENGCLTTQIATGCDGCKTEGTCIEFLVLFTSVPMLKNSKVNTLTISKLATG